MLTTLLTVALATSATTPADSLHLASKTVGFSVFVPDETAIGYTLTGFETGELGGKKVVHLTYTNKKVVNSFELLEYEAKGETGSGLKPILNANLFAVSIMEDDTVVSIKKGKTEISFLGSLMSNPSAKKMLERVVPVQP